MQDTKRHIFPIIFTSRHVQMENAYIFNVFPIYWQTEIIQGRANLIGSAETSISYTNTIVLPLLTTYFTSTGSARLRADYRDETVSWYQMQGHVINYSIEEG